MTKLLAEWFWTDRWMGSSAFLLPLEPRGLYREMLTQAWRRGGQLPNDPEAIRRAVGCTKAEWRRCWPKVQKFWEVSGEFLTNKTQVSVIAHAQIIHDSFAARGRKGGLQTAQTRKPSLEPSLEPSLSLAASPAQAKGVASVSVSVSEDQDQDLKAPPHNARRPTHPVENSDDSPTFALACVVMREALERSSQFDHDATLSNVGEHFKTLCAQRGLFYDADLVRVAYDAVTAAPRRRA